MGKTTKTTKRAPAKTKKAPAKGAVPVKAMPGAKKGGDLASQFAALAGGAAKTKPKKTKKQRPTLELDAETAHLFREWVPANVLFNHFKSHEEVTKAAVKDGAFNRWVTMMWEHQKQPANPALKAGNDQGQPDVEGMMVIQTKFKIAVANDVEAVEALVAQGIREGDAQKLVDAELDFTPRMSLVSFNELIYGHKGDNGYVEATAQEQAIANKMLKLLGMLPLDEGEEVEPLTEGEINRVQKLDNNVVVKDGFLDRVTSYVHSKDQLAAVFRVIQPVIALKGAKFAISDALNDKNQRLLEEAAGILGMALGEDEEEEEV